MKILVYGSKGWIGNQFIEILENKNLEFYKGESRLDNNDTLIKEIDDITLNPTFGSNTITFDVSYSIFDNVVKNLKNSTFKFTIDK
jgi:nucleoside-diphosphate-sugar epimerase